MNNAEAENYIAKLDMARNLQAQMLTVADGLTKMAEFMNKLSKAKCGLPHFLEQNPLFWIETVNELSTMAGYLLDGLDKTQGEFEDSLFVECDGEAS